MVFFKPIYIPWAQHGNLHPAGWPILFCGPTQEPVLAAANTGNTREKFWKNAGEWTGRVEISKEEIHGGKRNMCGHIIGLLQALKGEHLSSQQMGL